jgi:glucuronate isomerase
MPVEPAVREVALELYGQVAELPLISPHGHVDAAVLADDRAYADPVELLVRPDHYVLRLLHAHGASYADLGFRAAGETGPVAEPREVWRRLCRYWPVFRGTVMRLWLEDELASLFAITEPLTEGTADETYDHITAELGSVQFRPRALYGRFGLEVLATTDSPLADLSAHKVLRDDTTWEGRVIPTFRPDMVIDPSRTARWAEQLEALADVSGIDTTTYRGYISALESRRAAFKDLGATATDHGHLWPEALELSEREASRLYDRLRTGPHDPSDVANFSAHMIMEMARMSAEDGLVMQLHPGVWRSHDTAALTRYGPDIGGDFPVATAYTASLQRLLDRFGSHPGFRMVAFTVDETVFSRELAPMASYYPGLWLGAPWWFLDSPDAMTRFWGAITESAGFAKSAGFVDDTRAYCSVPARHDLARRAHCAFLARLVAEHRLEGADAADLAIDFAYRLPKAAFRLG